MAIAAGSIHTSAPPAFTGVSSGARANAANPTASRGAPVHVTPKDLLPSFGMAVTPMARSPGQFPDGPPYISTPVGSRLRLAMIASAPAAFAVS